MKDPNKLNFPGKEPDETVIIALRRHAMAVVKKIAIFIVAAIIPLALYLTVRAFTGWFNDQGGLLYLLFVLAASLLYLYLLLFVYHAWVDYYLDIWLVTNERLISIEQKGLFHRVVAELRLDRIQDVTSEVRGFLPTLFKYGTIRVQTASETDTFQFSEVPHPEIAARQILELHERYVGRDQPGQPPLAQPATVNKKPDENQPV